MVYSSGGDEFKRLWADIPTVETYWDYVGLANEIDDRLGDREITDFDACFLTDCLDRYAQMKGLQPRDGL